MPTTALTCARACLFFVVFAFSFGVKVFGNFGSAAGCRGCGAAMYTLGMALLLRLYEDVAGVVRFLLDFCKQGGL